VPKDRLYLLKPDFEEGGARFFCPECAMVEGMLSFYPQLRDRVDVRYVAYARPRPDIVAELGPDHQSSPCLVVADRGQAAHLAPHVPLREANGHAFLDDAHLICNYLAQANGTGRPHH
jgi:hypothetical protein